MTKILELIYIIQLLTTLQSYFLFYLKPMDIKYNNFSFLSLFLYH